MTYDKTLKNRLRKTFQIICLVVLLMAVIFTVQTPKAQAANGAAFNAGRIIDDTVFNNTNSMSVVDIQNFLNSKVPTCDRWHAAGSGSQGAQPPWTCLRDYTEGGKSAAQLIWEVGKVYDINPQVLLATLEKETGLVSDTWPYPWQYRTAMGMGCPDGAPCDSQYYGFNNQLYQGARHLRNFQQQNPNWTIPHRIGVNNIKWHPNAGCGTSQVNIENGATSALYSYTPYRPNQAALDNMYGTGDGCSSYGNRNFWRNFTDWFGSTSAVSYDYQGVSASISTVWMYPGQTVPSNSITIRNTGARTWYADGSVPVGQHPTRLMLAGYQNTPFADSADPNWLGTKNQIRMTTPTVAPGENATFVFNFNGPYQILNNYANHFVPVVDGVGAMKDINMQFTTFTTPPTYSGVSATNPPSVILNNQKVTASVTIKNTSLAPWYADGSVPGGKRATRLMSVGYQNTVFADPTDPNWLGTKNQIRMSPALVNPGENATFTFNLVGPFSYQNQAFRFVPVLDGVTGMADKGMQFNLVSPQPILNYSGISITNPPQVMAKGSVANATLVLRNDSNFTWRNESNINGQSGSVRIVMNNPIYRASNFFNAADTDWLSNSQIRMTTPTVAPGQNATFTFTWKAPTTAGSYPESFVPFVDGFGAMPNKGMAFTVIVQ